MPKGAEHIPSSFDGLLTLFELRAIVARMMVASPKVSRVGQGRSSPQSCGEFPCLPVIPQMGDNLALRQVLPEPVLRDVPVEGERRVVCDVEGLRGEARFDQVLLSHIVGEDRDTSIHASPSDRAGDPQCFATLPTLELPFSDGGLEGDGEDIGEFA